MKKHDVSGNRKIDIDELREILTDLDQEKRPPLPKNRMFFLMLHSTVACAQLLGGLRTKIRFVSASLLSRFGHHLWLSCVVSERARAHHA